MLFKKTRPRHKLYEAKLRVRGSGAAKPKDIEHTLAFIRGPKEDAGHTRIIIQRVPVVNSKGHKGYDELILGPWLPSQRTIRQMVA